MSEGAEGRGLHILVGIDGSSESRGALLTTMRLFGPIISRLTLAVVLDYDGDTSNVSVEEQERAQRTLAAAQAAAEGHDQRSQTVTLVGRPAPKLVAYARENGCDLIVIGPRGHGASRLLFGSVATHLAKHVAVPVAILPAPPDEM